MTHSINDIVDIPTLSTLLNSLRDAIEIFVAIVARDGSTLVETDGQDICDKFHRLHPETKAFCLECDTTLSTYCHKYKTLPKKPYYEHICGNGMVEIAFPVVINEKWLATLLIGQFFWEIPDKSFFRSHAKQFDFDQKKYLNVLKKVPVVSRRQIEGLLSFFAQLIHALLEGKIEETPMNSTDEKLFLERNHLENYGKTLWENNEWLRTFFRNTPTSMVIVSANGDLLQANPACCSALQYSRDELLELNIKDISHPDELQKTQQMYAELQNGIREVGDFEKRYIRKDGSILWGHSTVAPVWDTQGRLLYYVASTQDVTVGKQFEETLKSTLRRLQDIIDFLPDATFVIDQQGIIVAWNRAIEEMTGAKSTEMIGRGNYAYSLPFYKKRRPILIDLVCDDTLKVASQYDSVFTDNKTLRAEAFLPSAYGGKGAYLYGLAAPLFDHKGELVGAIESIRDISHQKKAETTLIKQTQMLEENNTALRVLLRQSAEAKEELGEKVHFNMKQLVFPYIDELAAILTHEKQKTYLGTIKENLWKITSAFPGQLSAKYSDLTPREIQIADLIRQGKLNKEIAFLLGVSVSAVDFHRRNLRIKLNIKGKKTNLRSFLLTSVG